jgi:hypothetical protein
MNILDHRILIPKSPQTIWEYIGDLSKNPSWQVDCSSLSFLTSHHSGVGMRWRYSTTSGREYVAEITAWYDGLGYEYTLVDGTQFRENKGRIRLQDIPEGTIVQWTFTYDMNGLLGGVRNTLSSKRQIENVMVNSLKTLWRVLNQAENDEKREAKSVVREGLNYEARAQYKPRHPSTKAVTQPGGVPAIIEPPVSDEDTRPRAPAVVVTPEEASHELAFLANLPPREVEDSLVILDQPSIVTPEIQLSDLANTEPDLVTPPGTLPEQSVIVDIAAPIPSPTPLAVDTPPVKLTETPSESIPGDSLPGVDTAAMSVFDVFGVPKPSETQEMHAVSVVEPVPSTVQSITVGQPKKNRTGLRLMLRQKRVRLRRPI